MALRIPSPVALTKPEAYLAYKAGILSRGELKDKLLNPINNYEGWLAKWCELLETYPTNEDGTPQCLTDEEGLLAYLCGVTNRYPASNSNPDDARVSAYIRYLVSARYARPDHPLNREEFYLSLIKTQFIPSGDPSSDIVIDGTTKAPFLDVKMYGDTLQNSYSGKNKMPMADADMTGEGEAGRNKTFRMALPAGTYTVSFDLDSFELGTNTAFSVYMQIYASSATALIDMAIINITSTTETGRKTVTFTINEDATTDRTDNIRIALTNWNNGARAKISNIQIESGITATDYEPYVGGTPAPNPDYPQPISVVTGENTVNVVGKNLLNLNGTLDRLYPTNLTYTQESNSVEITANTTIGAQYVRYIVEVPDASQNYYLSCKAKKIVKGTDGTPRVSVITAGSNNNTDWTDLSTGSMVVVDPTEGVEYSLGRTVSGYKYYRISFYNNNTTPVTLGEKTAYYDIQLERGSTATSYQAYTARDYEVNLGKNLLDIVAGTRTDADVEYSKGNGTASAIGTSARAAYAQAMNLVGTMISQGNYPNYGTITEENSLALPSGTYTLSATISNTGNTNGGLFIGVGDVGSRPASGERLSTTGSTSITLADGQRLYLSIWYEGTSTNKNVDLSVSNIQLEQGATATSYAPYFTPIELAGVGEIQPDGLPKYRDTIKQIDDKWYIEKNVGKMVFGGTENWTAGTGGTLRLFYSVQYSDVLSSNQRQDFLSNNFHFIASGNETGAGFIYQQRFYFYYGDMDTDADAFKTWLASNPTTVYYPLATPTTTEITNQSLIDQLNALKQGGAEEGTTYITVSATDPNLPAKLYVEAPKYD